MGEKVEPGKATVDVETTTAIKKKKEKGATVDLVEGFQATPQLLYEAFTDPRMIQAFTRAPAEVDLKVGGKFQLFGGSIEGEWTELVPHSKICQKWRFKDWEEGVYSIVEINFEAVEYDIVKVSLHHTCIPEDDKYHNHYQPQKVKDGWNNFYWDRIHKVLGYGKMDV